MNRMLDFQVNDLKPVFILKENNRTKLILPKINGRI